MVTRIGSNYNLVLMDMNIRRAREEHSRAAEPLASNQKINHLRDAPSRISEFFRLQNSLKRNEQYYLNINTARTRVNLTDAVLIQATDVANQVYELALQGNDQSLNTTQVTAITDRLSNLYDEMKDLANSKFGDTYLFSGFEASTIPFVNSGGNPPMNFQGDTNNVSIQVSATRSVQVSLNGDYYFTGDAAGAATTVDVFNTIDDLITDITNRDETNIATRITAVQDILDQFSGARSKLGNAMQQLDSTESMLETMELADTERLSVLSETDLAEATTNLSFKEYVLETAFAVSRRIMDVSLKSFFN
ncbi:MAG: hypothetical protein HQM16_05885 [Deltaproteobacteria bacterium]|nr:hypothetical protein [Deltaproteobacteria bacterium]